jgi:hypothetical protein
VVDSFGGLIFTLSGMMGFVCHLVVAWCEESPRALRVGLLELPTIFS